jgi:hypothetical protein
LSGYNDAVEVLFKANSERCVAATALPPPLCRHRSAASLRVVLLMQLEPLSRQFLNNMVPPPLCRLFWRATVYGDTLFCVSHYFIHFITSSELAHTFTLTKQYLGHDPSPPVFRTITAEELPVKRGGTAVMKGC